MKWLRWPQPWWLGAVALVAVSFGGLTLKASGSVLFVDGAARSSAGDYVSFVVWSNFVVGFAYIAAGAGVWAHRRWAVWLSFAIAGTTLVFFAAFGVHVLVGGAYELRTVGAMALRTGFWIVIGLVARHAMGEAGS